MTELENILMDEEMGFESEYESGYFEPEFEDESDDELASEFMEISSEDELEHFLGNLIRRAAGGIKTFAQSPVGQALVGKLKQAAKQYLPVAAKALGQRFGGATGATIAGKLGSLAASHLEYGGEMEYENAKKFVKVATLATRKAMQTAAVKPPRAAAKIAVITAVRRHRPNHAGHMGGRSGRWVRSGGKIVLLGA